MKYTSVEAYQNEVNSLIENREIFLENSRIVETHEMLSILPEEMFAASMFGIDMTLYGKYDKGQSNYTKDELAQLLNAAQSFIKNNHVGTMILVLDILIFNCQCQYAGMKIIMSEINEHLSQANIQHINIDFVNC